MAVPSATSPQTHLGLQLGVGIADDGSAGLAQLPQLEPLEVVEALGALLGAQVLAPAARLPGLGDVAALPLLAHHRRGGGVWDADPQAGDVHVLQVDHLPPNGRARSVHQNLPAGGGGGRGV